MKVAMCLMIIGVLGLPDTASECTMRGDIVFVMDASGSVKNNFDKEQQFVKNVISSVQVGPDQARIGVVPFNSGAYVAHYLDGVQTKQALFNVVDSLSGYVTGRTHTHKGLMATRNSALSHSRGNRADAQDIVILITDGKSDYPSETVTQSNMLHNMGAKIIVLGVGGSVNMNELNAMASDPDESYVHHVSSFSALNSYVSEFAEATCEGCPELPPIPQNGQRMGDTRVVGDKVSFECNVGYTLNGSPERTCQENQEWSGQVAYCTVSVCPVLPNPSNGRRIGDNREVGDKVSFDCNVGYTLNGSPERTCQVNKQWDGQTAYCTVSVCPELPSPENGRRVGDNVEYGSKVLFECNLGYSLHGSKERTCQANKQWDGETADCTLSTCPLLPSPENGQRIGDDYHVWEKVSFECIEGYYVEGSWERTCQPNKEWDGETTRCVLIPPEDIEPTEPPLPEGVENVRVEDYMPVVYNSFDILAQMGCMGRPTPTRSVAVWAMRRSCIGVKTCNQVCNHNRLECVHAYHVHLDPQMASADIDKEEGVNMLQTLSYERNEGCSWPAGHCGPNYCCCVGSWTTPFDD